MRFTGRTHKTDKGTWTPPGTEPQGNEPQGNEPTTETIAEGTANVAETQTAATVADGPQGGTEGGKPLGILGRLREDLDDLGELADALAKPDADIEEADTTVVIQRIDAVMVKLREAKKALVKSAKAKIKSTARTTATGTVGDDQ